MIFVASPLRFLFVMALLLGIWGLGKKSGVHLEKQGEKNFAIKIAPHRGKIIGLYIVGLFVLFILLLLESEIRYTVTASSIVYEQRTDVPIFEPIRLTPKVVVQRYAEDTFQNPQEYLGDSQIVLIDGKLKRVLPRLPEGLVLYFMQKLNGFVVVDVDTLERKVNIENTQFTYSEGVGIFDNLYFQLPLKKYFVEYASEPIYLKTNEGAWVTVVPYISYKGIIFRIPYWAGVMVIHPDGRIEDFSPEEAAQVSYLKGNRIHPKEIVHYYSHAYAYSGGLLNKWFLHENQTEVVNLPGDESIFHVPTNEGFKQLVVAEPYGQSYGIYKIFLFDATTGKRELIEYPQNSQLTGPVAAADYIKKEFPTYDWTVFSLSEPRPLKVGNDLYWLLSIIPNDAAGIASTVLLNTRTNGVVQVKREQELRAFQQGGTLPPPGGETQTNAELRGKIEEIERMLQELKNLVR